jgi:hypothetical protein
MLGRHFKKIVKKKKQLVPKLSSNTGKFSYLECSQIWLNQLMVDRHFSYLTKLLK